MTLTLVESIVHYIEKHLIVSLRTAITRGRTDYRVPIFALAFYDDVHKPEQYFPHTDDDRLSNGQIEREPSMDWLRESLINYRNQHQPLAFIIIHESDKSNTGGYANQLDMHVQVGDEHFNRHCTIKDTPDGRTLGNPVVFEGPTRCPLVDLESVDSLELPLISPGVDRIG